MTRDEHLLIILAEECNEVAHRVSKALRFGLSEQHPSYTENNAQMITDELNDLIAVVEMLQDGKIISKWLNREAIQAKKDKVIKYMEYSAVQGTLIEKD